jgi:hypothetical protein
LTLFNLILKIKYSKPEGQRKMVRSNLNWRDKP